MNTVRPTLLKLRTQTDDNPAHLRSINAHEKVLGFLHSAQDEAEEDGAFPLAQEAEKVLQWPAKPQAVELSIAKEFCN